MCAYKENNVAQQKAFAKKINIVDTGSEKHTHAAIKKKNQTHRHVVYMFFCAYILEIIIAQLYGYMPLVQQLIIVLFMNC